jgi:hypothetical protein
MKLESVKFSVLLVLVLLLTASACKKENPQNVNTQNVIEFDLDGVHHSFTPSEALLERDTFSSGIVKTLFLSRVVDTSTFYLIAISEDISSTTTPDCILTGIYPSVHSDPGCSDSLNNNCREFNFKFSENNVLLSNSFYVADLDLTSCNSSPKEISGTFSGTLSTRDSSLVKQLTNGKIIEVRF